MAQREQEREAVTARTKAECVALSGQCQELRDEVARLQSLLGTAEERGAVQLAEALDKLTALQTMHEYDCVFTPVYCFV